MPGMRARVGDTMTLTFAFLPPFNALRGTHESALCGASNPWWTRRGDLEDGRRRPIGMH